MDELKITYSCLLRKNKHKWFKSAIMGSDDIKISNLNGLSWIITPMMYDNRIIIWDICPIPSKNLLSLKSGGAGR